MLMVGAGLKPAPTFPGGARKMCGFPGRAREPEENDVGRANGAIVTPAKAGVQGSNPPETGLDSGLRRND